MFEITDKPAQLLNFNPRREKNGTDGVPAADLHFMANLDSGVLACFAPTLRSFLYYKSEAVQEDLANEAHDAPNLRFPKLAPLKWTVDYVGFELRIHVGINAKSHIVISDCAVNGFELSPQEGGTCGIKFRVQFHPDEKTAGKLSMLLASPNVNISVTAPEDAHESRAGEADKDGNVVPMTTH